MSPLVVTFPQKEALVAAVLTEPASLDCVPAEGGSRGRSFGGTCLP